MTKIHHCIANDTNKSSNGEKTNSFLTQNMQKIIFQRIEWMMHWMQANMSICNN